MEKMDSDVDGRSAFEMLLNRLIEEAREGHMVRERLGDTAGDLRIAEKQFHEAVTEMQRLQARVAEYVRGEESINDLYDAAEAFERVLRDAIGRTGQPIGRPRPNVGDEIVLARAALLKALKNAKQHVVAPIPF